MSSSNAPSLPYRHLFAGAVAGTGAALLTCPLDVLKTRLQSSEFAAIGGMNLRSLTAKVVREEGCVVARDARTAVRNPAYHCVPIVVSQAFSALEGRGGHCSGRGTCSRNPLLCVRPGKASAGCGFCVWNAETRNGCNVSWLVVSDQ